MVWGSGGGGGVSRAGMGNLQDPPSSSSESSSSPSSNSKRGLTLRNATPTVAPSLVSLSTSFQGFDPAWPRTSPDDSDCKPDPDWVRVSLNSRPYHDDDEFPISDALVFRFAPSSHEVSSAILPLQQVVAFFFSQGIENACSKMLWLLVRWLTATVLRFNPRVQHQQFSWTIQLGLLKSYSVDSW